MHDTITVGIDGSAASVNAAAWAAREARRRGLGLHVVHVDDIGPGRRTGLPELDAPAGRVRDTLNRARRTLTYGNPGLQIVSSSLMGPPAPALVNAARDSAALVVGSQGCSALGGLLVGSVALAVTAEAPCPVVLVASPRPRRHVTRRTGGGPAEPVIAGIDLDHSCDEVLSQAFAAAELREAPLIVVHVWSLPLMADTSSGIPEPESTKQVQLAAVVGPWLKKYPGTPVTERLVHGTAGRVLRQAGERARLLVVGRRINEDGRLGGTLHSVIHHVTACPVIVIPHD
ncbi:universal stress protein [Streptomyces sp. AM8-1-1]|uniref:universal stress protein n=1 Tax=Streptomyces sp. AM8-1-1 TaxID=3075825 RepID=UPI0028C41AF5|nr:universal stress protein [Streptomyces sp. AM8-1-1]WNO70265.1 universal stress protein [Streptomyces sp. AM8-1-1]